MELEVFQFTNDTLTQLRSIKKELNYCGDILDDFFFYLLDNSCDGFFNISTRVKSPSSLKEKIIRHNYYLKYTTPEDLFSKLSDLIGVRIECRFIEDERKIFNYIKSTFCETSADGFSYYKIYPNIFLDLRHPQPLKQKNGFKLFRIDGYIINEGKKYNFELQIKSMVNTFWGEIEHKVIYKNYNMLLGDTFYKNILHSIKSNLSLIDNQLLTIYNHIDGLSTKNSNHSLSRENLEMLLSKTIFDIYSYKIKTELSISVDFRNACNIIIDYIFSKKNCNTPQDYYNTFVNTSIRLNEIYSNSVSFKDKLFIENYIDFPTDFSQALGNKLTQSMNYDFHWNVFFKILFEIEPGNNTEDFISFIKYLEITFSNRDSYLNLHLKFSQDETQKIKNDILDSISKSFLKVDSLKFIYRDELTEIFNAIDQYTKFICHTVNNYSDYIENRNVYSDYLYLTIISIFDTKISLKWADTFIENIISCDCNIDFSANGLQYIDSINPNSKVSSNKLMQNIYIK